MAFFGQSPKLCRRIGQLCLQFDHCRTTSKPISANGDSTTALDYVINFSLPLQMLNMSVIHYIAHFRAKNDYEARLQGFVGRLSAIPVLGHGGRDGAGARVVATLK